MTTAEAQSNYVCPHCDGPVYPDSEDGECYSQTCGAGIRRLRACANLENQLELAKVEKDQTREFVAKRFGGSYDMLAELEHRVAGLQRDNYRLDHELAMVIRQRDGLLFQASSFERESLWRMLQRWARREWRKTPSWMRLPLVCWSSAAMVGVVYEVIRALIKAGD